MRFRVRSDMFSETKKRDKEFALTLAELIELLARIGTTESIDLAERFGGDYLRLQEKIKTYDYSKDDRYQIT